jgi:hypothetical protein
MNKSPVDHQLTLQHTAFEQSVEYSQVKVMKYIPFPWKLHEMLDAAEKECFDSIVSWLPNEDAFKVHAPHSFVTQVMSRYFNHTQFKSFQRQLNMWGFQRINHGPCKGAYKHLRFIRGKPSLCRFMKRLKNKMGATTLIQGSVPPKSSSPRSSDISIIFDDEKLPPAACLIDTKKAYYAHEEQLLSLSDQNLSLDTMSWLYGDQTHRSLPELSSEDLKYVLIGFQLGSGITLTRS